MSPPTTSAWSAAVPLRAKHLLIVLGCMIAVLLAGVLHHILVLGIEPQPRMMTVPASVGALFGLLLMHILRLRERQEQQLRLIAEREEVILGLNQTLEDRVEVRTRELREKEEQLLVAQKMEAVGQLAGGVAHDFNNMLTVILVAVTQLELSLSANDKDMRLIEEIRTAAERSAELTRRLLAFGRQQMLVPRIFDLREVIDQLRSMLRRLLGERIELEVESWPTSVGVNADPGQLGQVLVNLVMNARDASAAGSRITVRTAIVARDELPPPAARLSASRFGVLSIEDRGHGMDEQTMRRAVDPFFTTKAVGEGTGLGLSAASGIVQQSGGELVLDSAPGSGTTAKVILPLVEEKAKLVGPAAELTERSHATSDVASQTTAQGPGLGAASVTCDGPLLVVDDEQSVRDLLEGCLVQAGYPVIVAADAEDALCWATEHDGSIALLISDVVLPGMSGFELVRQLRQQRPDLRALMMTGYAAHTAGAEWPNVQVDAVMEKPFSPVELLRLVTQSLSNQVSAQVGGQ